MAWVFFTLLSQKSINQSINQSTLQQGAKFNSPTVKWNTEETLHVIHLLNSSGSLMSSSGLRLLLTSTVSLNHQRMCFGFWCKHVWCHNAPEKLCGLWTDSYHRIPLSLWSVKSVCLLKGSIIIAVRALWFTKKLSPFQMLSRIGIIPLQTRTEKKNLVFQISDDQKG